MEVSVIAARGWNGRVAVYDVPENHHEQGILRTSTVPARILRAWPRRPCHGQRVIEGLDYVGVIGIEMFVAGDEVIVNEIAPRVHNSGIGPWMLHRLAVRAAYPRDLRLAAGTGSRHSDVVMTNLLATR